MMPAVASRVLAAVVFAGSLPLAAQDSALNGPVSGLLVDEQTRSIRRIVGLPGAAYAADAAVRDFDFASVSPGGQDALVAQGGSLYLVRRLDGGAPLWRELARGNVSVARAAWSADSESLALMNASANRVELWTALSSEPRLAATIDASGLAGSIVSLAVDSSAGFAVAATQGESTGTLYLLRAGQGPLILCPLGAPGALALSGGTLYVADRGRGEVLRVTNWDQTPSFTTVASKGNGLDEPVGLAVSSAGDLLYVASASRRLLVLDLTSGAVRSTHDLDYTPTSLEPLGSSSLLLLARGAAGAEPAQFFDTRSNRLFFVPVTAGKSN